MTSIEDLANFQQLFQQSIPLKCVTDTFMQSLNLLTQFDSILLAFVLTFESVLLKSIVDFNQFVNLSKAID